MVGGIMIIIGFLLFSVAITNDDDQEEVDDIENQVYEEETGRNTDNLMNNNTNVNYRKL